MEIKISKVCTFKKDKRKSVNELYRSFFKLKKTKWISNVLFNQKFKANEKDISLPILGFKTRRKGNALWIISGIHGEEPAGPNAISKNIKLLNKLSRQIPIVLLPLCNPKGYIKNWRYPGLKKARKNKKIKSVGDSEHYLISLKNPRKPRKKKPSSKEAAAITNYVIKNSKKYPPLLVLDFHEDKGGKGIYIYSQGILGSDDPVAKEIVSILKKRKFQIYKRGNTVFNQEIKNGIVSGINDGSIDELLSSKNIIVKRRIKPGPSAKSVIVIETHIRRIPLKKRIRTHSYILKNSRRFFATINNIFKEPS